MLKPLRAYFRDRAGITDSQFELLAPFLVTRKVVKHDVLLKTGDICENIIFVGSGCLRSYTVDSKGKEYIVQFAPENWWVSDLSSFLKQEPATSYIDALEESEITLLPRTLYDRLDTLQPSLYKLFQSLLSNNNMAVQKRLMLSLSASAEERYKAFIESYPMLLQRLPQHMIASYLGIAPESLSRVRRNMAQHKAKN